MEDYNKQQTILIVDDAKTNISILSELLRGDYRIKAATSGQRALEIAFSDDAPDLILLDVIMPEMDGYEVCRLLKADERTKAIPVIFITGQAEEKDEVLGFSLGAVDYIAKPFSPVVVKARVSTHTELKRTRDILENISYLDGLTGIANRRKFNEYLVLTWNIAKRERLPLSIVMIDIDYFKDYNDYYGHQAGDDCLKQVAQALSGALLRKTDLLCRYGGEEFVVVLVGTDLDGSLVIAERLRKSVLDLQLPHEKSQVNSVVSVSLGVSSMNTNLLLDADELVKAADTALYTSKQQGRNRSSGAFLTIK